MTWPYDDLCDDREQSLERVTRGVPRMRMPLVLRSSIRPGVCEVCSEFKDVTGCTADLTEMRMCVECYTECKGPGRC